VTAALEELIARREQGKFVQAVGTFDSRKDWDYKKERRGHRH
jgi:hypothetical protein